MSRLSIYQTDKARLNLANELSPTSPDHRAELKALWDKYNAQYDYYIPRGMKVKIPIADYRTGVCPRLYSNMKILGDGSESQILFTGFETINDGAFAGIVHTYYDNPGPVDSVQFENLALVGDGPGDSQTWSQKQSAAIRFLPHSDGPITRTLFRKILFLNIDGFPFHSDGIDDKFTRMEWVEIKNCGNGINANGDFFSAVAVEITNSEGFECSGAGLILADFWIWSAFEVGISAGGNQSTGAFPGPRLDNINIYEIKGGTGYGSGNGIVLAESMPDAVVSHAYVERTYGQAFISTHSGTLGVDDGATWLGCTAVNAGSSVNLGITPGNTGFSIVGRYNKLSGCRVYNRISSPNDEFPLGNYRSLYGAVINGDGTMIDTCDFDMSNAGHYPLQLSAGATNTRIGKSVRMVPGTGYPFINMIAGSSVIDASTIAETFRDASAAFVAKVGDKKLWSIPSTGAKNITLFSGVGLLNYHLTCQNRGNGTYPVTVTPAAGETINANASPISLVSANASATLVWDGSGWWIESGYGTIS